MYEMKFVYSWLVSKKIEFKNLLCVHAFTINIRIQYIEASLIKLFCLISFI